MLDTRDKHGRRSVSFGLEFSGKWGGLTLRDGTALAFDQDKWMLHAQRLDERNLVACELLSLSDALALAFLDVRPLRNLRALVLWRCAIEVLDATPLDRLELLVYGVASSGAQQTVKGRPGVQHRRYDAAGELVAQAE